MAVFDTVTAAYAVLFVLIYLFYIFISQCSVFSASFCVVCCICCMLQIALYCYRPMLFISENISVGLDLLTDNPSICALFSYLVLPDTGLVIQATVSNQRKVCPYLSCIKCMIVHGSCLHVELL